MDDDLSDEPGDFQLDIDPNTRDYLKNYPTVVVYLAMPLTGISDESTLLLRSARTEIRQVLQKSPGYRFDVYDPAEHTAPGTSHRPAEVYSIDHGRVVRADVVFFLGLDRSIGLGMEAQITASATIPRVVFHYRKQPLTRMFLGAPSRTLATIPFESMEELNIALTEQMEFIGREAFDSRSARNAAYENGFKNFGQFILRARIRRQVPLNELAKKTDQTPDWISQIERSSGPAPISMELFLRVCDILQINVLNDCASVCATSKMTSLSETAEKSLRSLTSFVVSRRQIDDSRLLQLWSRYLSEREEIESAALVGREDFNRPITEAEWKARYEQRGLFD